MTSGPTTGTISKTPAGESPISSQYGTPIEPEREREHDGDEHDEHELAAHECAELVVDQQSTCRASRVGAAAGRATVRGRSFGRVRRSSRRATANMKKMPMSDLERGLRHGERGVDDVSCPTAASSAASGCATRISCLIPCECCACWCRSLDVVGTVADRLLDLRGRARDDEPEHERDAAPSSAT